MLCSITAQSRAMVSRSAVLNDKLHSLMDIELDPPELDFTATEKNAPRKLQNNKESLIKSKSGVPKELKSELLSVSPCSTIVSLLVFLYFANYY